MTTHSVRTLLTILAVATAVIFTPFNSLAAEAAGHDGEARTVLITGANRGLGLEFARQYSAAGWKVIGTARKPATATDLKDLGVRVIQLDVADAESVAAMAAVRRFAVIFALLPVCGGGRPPRCSFPIIVDESRVDPITGVRRGPCAMCRPPPRR